MTMTPQLPPTSTVPALPTESRAAILDALFEPSVPLHTLSVSLLAENAFESYDDLIAAVRKQLEALHASPSTSDGAWLEKILSAHPRLGEKKVDSALSREEQAGLHQGDDKNSEKLKALNEEYEKVFPGLRYVVLVNGRSLDEVMDDMRARIQRGNLNLEKVHAIKAMCDIASNRARKLSSTATVE